MVTNTRKKGRRSRRTERAEGKKWSGSMLYKVWNPREVRVRGQGTVGGLGQECAAKGHRHRGGWRFQETAVEWSAW